MALLYADLQTQILNYAQKEAYDPVSESGDQNFTYAIPFFINLALEKIYRDVQTLDRNVVLYGNIPSPQYLISKIPVIPPPPLFPSPLWYQTVSFYIGIKDLSTAANVERTPLFKRTYEFCKGFIGLIDDQGNPLLQQPLFYSDTDNNNFFIAPVPDQTYYYEITYEGMPPTLTIPTPTADDIAIFNTSWVMQKYPSLMFYAAYIEALRYMGKGDEIPLYQGLYDQTIQSINSQNRLRNIDRTSVIEKA